MKSNNWVEKYKEASIIIKIILINAIIFIGFGLVSLMPFGNSLYSAFTLPPFFLEYLEKPWSLLSYGFLHSGVWHIGVNMLMFYWVGQYILNLFTPRRLLTVYFLGMLFGGVFFLCCHFFAPFDIPKRSVVGASAAVMSALVFIASYAPNTEVMVARFRIKLWYIGLFFVLFDLIRLPTSGNAGGLLTHIGGAIFGYVYARQLVKGNDIGQWFERMVDAVINFFKPQKQYPFKKVYRNTSKKVNPKVSKRNIKSDQQKKIDAILDKISKSGYESLTRVEKDFLFRAGKDT